MNKVNKFKGYNFSTRSQQQGSKNVHDVSHKQILEDKFEKFVTLNEEIGEELEKDEDYNKDDEQALDKEIKFR